MIGQRRKNVKRLKIIYYNRSLVSNFVQTCSSLSIYNGMYTVCSFKTPQWQVRFIELETEQVKLKSLCKILTGNSHKTRTAYLLTCTKNEIFSTRIYANAPISYQNCKDYISMYLDEYLTKLWLSAK